MPPANFTQLLRSISLKPGNGDTKLFTYNVGRTTPQHEPSQIISIAVVNDEYREKELGSTINPSIFTSLRPRPQTIKSTVLTDNADT